MPRCPASTLVLALAALLAYAPARAEQWATTPYHGVAVPAFDRRETWRIFRVPGTAVVAFDGYAADPEAVLVLTTRRGQCVDSGKLDASGPLPMIRLAGRCRGITGLLLGAGPAGAAVGLPAR